MDDYYTYNDFIIELLRDNLKDSYKMISEDGFDPKLLKALKRVIKFYSDPSQYKEWKEKLNEPC